MYNGDSRHLIVGIIFRIVGVIDIMLGAFCITLGIAGMINVLVGIK